MTYGALILSAGCTASRGGLDPMRKVGSISAVQRLIMSFHLAGAEPIVVVVSGEDEPRLERYAGRNGVVLLRGGDGGAEMFDNAKLGLAYHMERGSAGVLVTPVDIPLFSVDTIRALVASGQSLASPVCEGRGGHPLLISAEIIPDILSYRGENGLRGAVRECGHEKALVEVDDPGVYVRSEQFHECEKIVESHGVNQWRPVMKLQIAKESAFFGPGSWQLLSLIETTGSVRLASGQMGISYSKAWKILNNLEEQAGYHVITRRKGGKNGGETLLTDKGRALLERFESFERECARSVDRIFQKHFPGV